MDKQTQIGYRLNRMNMTTKDRQRLAAEERNKILIPIYGADYLERFLTENISQDEMSMHEAYHGQKL